MGYIIFLWKITIEAKMKNSNNFIKLRTLLEQERILAG